MAKQKTGFIKIKHPGFKKLFNKKERSSLWKMFKDNFETPFNRTIDWKNSHYLDYIRGRGIIPVYPETDISDDSEGISPKQLRQIVDLIGIDNLKILFIGLSKISSLFSNNTNTFSDNFISWKEVYKLHLEKEVKNKNYEFFGRIIFYQSINILSSLHPNQKPSRATFPYSLDSTVFKNIAKDHRILLKVMKLKDNSIYPFNTVIDMSLLDTKSYFKNREKIWMKNNGFVPKNNKLLSFDTKLWDKDVFLNSMNILYGTKQLRNLNTEDSNNFLDLYKVFNKSLEFFAPLLLNKDINVPQTRWPVLEDNFSLKGIERISNLSKKGITVDITIEQYIYIQRALSYFKNAESSFLKKDSISIDDLNELEDIGKNAVGIFKEHQEYLKFISWENIRLFKKINLSWGMIQEYIELYKETKDIELKTIPLVKGTYGEYTYEILPKSDIRGLVCGVATNCCQHLSNVGISCTLYGAYEEDSAFFIVSKNGDIVAQSWLWMSDDNKTMVCDSIEALNRSKNILSCYKEMAKDVFKKSQIKNVFCGDSPFGNELEDVTAVNIPECPDYIYDMLEDNEYAEIDDGLYSDAHSQHLIARKG